MTYITKRCGKCGFSRTLSIYGHMNDPIGIRVARCPACGAIQKEDRTREWIQMTPLQKYLAINPRGTIRVGFCSIFLSVPLVMAADTVIPSLWTETEGINFGVWFLFYLVTFAVLHYLFTILKLSGDVFRKRYCSSLLRSRNPSYLTLLRQEGPVYGEEIPSWIYCSDSTRQKFREYMQQHWSEVNFRVPSFLDTVSNDI